ncbi:CobQ/CobB/MinD/ParA nucleotide binding domain-containing protein [Pseudomethylobacillus aquaticus]|uniref:CobQ/CobB/MinD/ParA nucleotide binding domain-containing protein n=1 Tax=Pseudomethylobacillus aquaticus TaxID=2676064 RepID=A0A3N0UY66_9PROT|nr:AAA family ATPase [Pseudomethylobacillus aquaticus]ROH85403.1 CobQ/CobB/MinD/ParA nucleotide binding domain-containing protein [Pseudomethylobacillus aquaticus]
MKALIVSTSTMVLDALAAQCALRSPPVQVTRVQGGMAEAIPVMERDPADILIVDFAGAVSQTEMQALQALGLQFPRADLMLLAMDESPGFLLQAMRAGVREILSFPLDTAALTAALDRSATKYGVKVSHHGKVLSFIAAKGGSGTTFITTNLAWLLAASGHKVLLIDLNRPFGDAVLYVSDRQPTVTLADVCAQIERMDAGFLQSSLVDVAPSLGILAACHDVSAAADITPDQVGRIVQLACQHYDYVLLDTGRDIDAVSLRALDMADQVFPVLQLSLPALHDGQRLLTLFRSLDYTPKKVQLLINRYSKNGKLGLELAEQTLGARAVQILPDGAAVVSDAIDQGLPVEKSAPQSTIAKALRQLAQDISGSAVPEKTGLLARMLARTGSRNKQDSK